MLRIFRGIAAAVRSRLAVLLGVSAAVALFDLAAPVVLLSLARKPVDFFTFNPWLRRLPDYLRAPGPALEKFFFLSHLTIAWASADAPEGIAWGFIVDVPALARIAATSLLLGLYFALWSYTRGSPSARPAGVAGALSSVFGLTTAPCTLAGCGAPVLPVVGLAFTGASAGTLAGFALLSRIGLIAMWVALAAAVAWFGWHAGGANPAATLPSKRNAGIL